VAPALTELSESGTVRIIDLAFVRKDVDGKVSFVEVEDADVSELLKSVNGGQFDLLNDEDLVAMAEALDPGYSALVIVWETPGLPHSLQPSGPPTASWPRRRAPRKLLESHRRVGRGIGESCPDVGGGRARWAPWSAPRSSRGLRLPSRGA